MGEYIERVALLQDVSETVLFSVRGGTELPTPEMRGANKVIDRIKSTPAADVAEVRHGRWDMEIDLADVPYGICSLCGHSDYDVFRQGGHYEYCPRCGAKMDGEENEDVT